MRFMQALILDKAHLGCADQPTGHSNRVAHRIPCALKAVIPIRVAYVAKAAIADLEVLELYQAI